MYYDLTNKWVQRWTEGSVFCYERGCNCKGCFVQDLIKSQKCLIKSAVIELVRKYGIPPEEANPKDLTDKEKRIIEAILDGCNTFKDIAERLNIKNGNVQQSIHGLYNKAREYYNFVFMTTREKMLQEFIHWVRNGGFESETEK